MSETHVTHTKPLNIMQSLSESRGGSKVTKLNDENALFVVYSLNKLQYRMPIFNNSAKR